MVGICWEAIFPPYVSDRELIMAQATIGWSALQRNMCMNSMHIFLICEPPSFFLKEFARPRDLSKVAVGAIVLIVIWGLCHGAENIGGDHLCLPFWGQIRGLQPIIKCVYVSIEIRLDAGLACIIYATRLSVSKGVCSSGIMGGVNAPPPLSQGKVAAREQRLLKQWQQFVCSALRAPKSHHEQYVNDGACGECILQCPSSRDIDVPSPASCSTTF